MTQDTEPGATERHVLRREVFGVPFTVEAANAELAAAFAALLPPQATLSEGGPAFVLDAAGELGDLDARVRRHIAMHAPAHVFVHAGVVEHRGRAIVLPARTHAGKSELVAALVRAGAGYCSDEYAVIDAAGRVHPYARPLTLRGRDGDGAVRVTAEDLGGHTIAEPLPVGSIVGTAYAPGARWAAEPRTAAEGALLLLAHAGQGREHPERVLDALHRAAAGATVLEGPRGEAAAAAGALLA